MAASRSNTLRSLMISRALSIAPNQIDVMTTRKSSWMLSAGLPPAAKAPLLNTAPFSAASTGA